ncbi:hypothetical protein AGLY_008189 [Aphis glycines]|uniref:Uncharacterized protein n=1 Tax=Aphis glycines TaxID=307491 RepID=A0A6G0TLP3_APHGL|nr:hypothetical protein AGLY_008189 [Aphis glycines]
MCIYVCVTGESFHYYSLVDTRSNGAITIDIRIPPSMLHMRVLRNFWSLVNTPLSMRASLSKLIVLSCAADATPIRTMAPVAPRHSPRTTPYLLYNVIRPFIVLPLRVTEFGVFKYFRPYITKSAQILSGPPSSTRGLPKKPPNMPAPAPTNADLISETVPSFLSIHFFFCAKSKMPNLVPFKNT